MSSGAFSSKEMMTAFFEKRIQDNLSFFEKEIPSLFEIFSDYSEENYYVIFDEAGQCDIYDKESDQLLYSGELERKVSQNLEDFYASPAHKAYFSIRGLNEKKFDNTNYLHTDMMQDIGLIQKEFINSSEVLLSTKKSGASLPEVINSLLVFSVGTGLDVDRLLQERSVKRLYIVEPNLDIFYASMHFVDWGNVFNRVSSAGGSVYLGVSTNKEELVNDLGSALAKGGRHNVAGCYLYSSLFLDGYEKIYEEVKNLIDYTIFAGYGFYDDSRISFAHTYHNFKNKIPCMGINKEMNGDFGQKDIPAIIVGSGPSLDADLKFLKDNRDNYILFSCGTALKALYVNGIQPDFHVDLERTAHIPHWIRNSGSGADYENYLQGINFFGASQVHPDAFKLFGRAVQGPKDTESGSHAVKKAFPEYNIPLLPRMAPSCVHTGFSLAVILGFREIYMFGVDMGYKSLDKHHSKYSLYNDLNDKSKEVYEVKNYAQVEYESNFGDDVVYSSGFYPMFKRLLEAHIQGWNVNLRESLSVYNCSDGAMVKGAAPQRASEIAFDKNRHDCDIDSMISAFFNVIPLDSDIAKLDVLVDEMGDKIESMSDWAIKKIDNQEIKSISDANNLIDELAISFHTKIEEIGLSEDDSWLYTFYDGSLLYAFSAINSLVYFPCDEAVKIKYISRCFMIMKQFFYRVKLDCVNMKFCDQESFYDMV